MDSPAHCPRLAERERPRLFRRDSNAFYLLTTLVAQRALLRYTRRLKTVDVEDLLGSCRRPADHACSCRHIMKSSPASSRSVRSSRCATTPMRSYSSTTARPTRRWRAWSKRSTSRPVQRAPVSDVTQPPRSAASIAAGSHPALWLLDKENGGSKADALNAGIAFCRTPLFCAHRRRQPAGARRADADRAAVPRGP